MNTIHRTRRVLGAVLAAAAITLSTPAVSSAEPTPAAQSAYDREASTGYRDWPFLQKGSRGGRVRVVQLILKERGHAIAVDGVFGADTARRLARTQRYLGLRGSGDMTDRTWERILPTVSEGDRGYEVVAVQRRLGASGRPVRIDGVFGDRTSEAMSYFQTDGGLKPDRVVGPRTWFRLVWGQ